MPMTENEHLDRIKQLAVMKELPIIDEDALLEFQLSKSDPLQIEEEYINAYIPITFDANKAFGLDIGQDNDDNIDLYAEWRVGEVDSLAMYVTYRNNSTVDGDFYFRVPLDERQQQRIYARLEEQCRAVYGKSVADMVREANRQEKISMTKDKFWSIIDRVRTKADMQDEESVKKLLYAELIQLPQDELLGFDCAWQSYRNKANFPKMVAAARIINDGSSDDRFTDFRNWLIMQGHYAYRQAVIDPDSLAALSIPFRDTEWMGCGYVAWYAYAGQQLRIYFENEGIAAELHRKYPTLLKSPDDLYQAIMQEQLVPYREPETEWERQMLRTEIKHYIEVSDLAYSYNKFYAQNTPDKVAWETLQSDLFANLPQIKAERMPQDFSVVLPKLWRKRQAWDAEREKRPHYHGEER